MNTTIWKLKVLPHTNDPTKLDEMVLIQDVSHPKVQHYAAIMHIDSFMGNDEVYSKLNDGEEVLVTIKMVKEG